MNELPDYELKMKPPKKKGLRNAATEPREVGVTYMSLNPFDSHSKELIESMKFCRDAVIAAGGTATLTKVSEKREEL